MKQSEKTDGIRRRLCTAEEASYGKTASRPIFSGPKSQTAETAPAKKLRAAEAAGRRPSFSWKHDVWDAKQIPVRRVFSARRTGKHIITSGGGSSPPHNRITFSAIPPSGGRKERRAAYA